MKIGILSFSENGNHISEKISKWLKKSHYNDVEIQRCEHGKLAEWTEMHFKDDAIIYIGSTGIAVRAIAPFVCSKLSDPAVIVIDELGAFCIPLLSGHIGGANLLASSIARFIDAKAVITTATDRNNVFAVDEWAVSQGMIIYDTKNILPVAVKLLNKEKTLMISEVKITGKIPDGITLKYIDKAYKSSLYNSISCDVLVSPRYSSHASPLHIVPRVTVLGIGCRRGTTKAEIETAYVSACKQIKLHPKSLAKICTIDIKKNESGLLEFASEYGILPTFYNSDELKSVSGDIESSDFVTKITGVDNVCERSAILGSGSNGKVLMKKNIINGIAISLYIANCEYTFDYK